MTARTPLVPVNPRVLQWAREAAGHNPASAAQRLQITVDRLLSWERGDEKPSLAKLRDVADLYRRTIAFFLLAEPPGDVQKRPPDFRGDGEQTPDIAGEIMKANDRREVFLELHGPPDDDAPLSNASTPRSTRAAATFWRAQLGVTTTAQFSADSYGALRLWIDAVQRAGALVFQMSRIPLARCRGFSVFHDPWPVIVLNGADRPEAKCFTLMHELRHITLRSGGICHVYEDSRVETECNRFAAALLMPEDQVRSFVSSAAATIPSIARAFSVSQEAMAIRLHELDMMSAAELDAFRAELRARDALREDDDGFVPPHRLKLRNLGTPYVETVLDAYYNDRIGWSDVTHYLESKTTTVEKMANAISSSRAS